jgi:hypothetical protein
MAVFNYATNYPLYPFPRRCIHTGGQIVWSGASSCTRGRIHGAGKVRQ